ncbi:HAD family hydrolase [Aquibaculum arenosum]|uniref:phosphoglycolate phosphatase n=1 Tax=Aquibaculum arenosum TaxID=3032591 RepID=A0ABT5YM77_9PROT|nr:HAD family hydrolase [Fodinicurvata sp. CAU 1616]MDF2096062.1 HAD family hydrolase [Fodinicurvata sp. CAU 1616]
MDRPTPSAIKGLLFDKDGTLLDFARSWVPLNRRAALAAADQDPALAAQLLAAGGHDPESDHVTPGSLLAAADAGGIAAYWAEMLPGRDPTRLARLIDDVFENGVAEAVAVDSLVEVLESLHGSGYRLGLATSDGEAAAHATLERFGIATLFSFVAGWDSGHGRKPEPGMLQAFCRSASLAPQSVAMIGDSPQDMVMGQTAGAGLLVGVLTGTALAEDLQPPAHRVLPSIAALPELLAGS